jgi:hypothetical protein
VEWSRESQSANNPSDTLRSCSLSERNDGRSSGEWLQHFLITWNMYSDMNYSAIQ